MKPTTKVISLVRSNFSRLFRSKVVVALMFILPLYFITIMNMVHPERPIMIPVGDKLVMEILEDLATRMVVPVVVSIIGGVVGFFIMKGNKLDPRLEIAGFKKIEILFSRLTLLLLLLIFTTGYCFLVMFYLTIPSQIGWFVLGVFLTGAIYTLIGVLAGIFLGKLPGIYLMLFMPTFDLMLFQSPMVDQDSLGNWVRYLPGYNPMKIVLRASVGVEQDLIILIYSLIFLILLFGLVVVISFLSTFEKNGG